MSQLTRFRSFAVALGAAAFVALTSGCYAEAGVEPAYVDASAPPGASDAAPQYAYEGRPVYYVNGHWYAQDRGHWHYYRSEPEELQEQRLHVASAPHPVEYAQNRPAPHEAP